MSREGNAQSTQTMRRFAHLLSIVAVLGCDWFIYMGNMLTHLDAVTAWVVTGSLAAGIVTLLAEREVGGASWLASSVRAGLAAVLVAAPLPLLGTVVAAAATLWALISMLLYRPSSPGISSRSAEA
jgi:hypothetical protein